MEIFEGDDSSDEDGSLLCAGEFVLNCGVTSGDAPGVECAEDH